MFLSSCAGQTLSHYEGATPAFDLQEYFTGPVKAWGIVQDRSGNIVRRFDVDMVGTWDGDTGTLDEDFRYYDGKTEKRIWTITRTGTHTYEGTAGDILGVAKGEKRGNALRWAYQMDLPVGDSTYRVNFDDWMYQMNDGVLINRSYIKKFGITFAELTIFFKKDVPEN
mgnify:CR=1 FL=1